MRVVVRQGFYCNDNIPNDKAPRKLSIGKFLNEKTLNVKAPHESRSLGNDISGGKAGL